MESMDTDTSIKTSTNTGIKTGAEIETASTTLEGAGASGLAAWLEALDPGVLSRGGVLDMLEGCRSLESWVQARRLEAVAVLVRKASPLEAAFVAGEVAATLRLSDIAASSMVGLAVDLAERLPGTFLALSSGSITERHAAAIAEQVGLVDLDEAALRVFEAKVLRDADTRNVAQLRRIAGKAVAAADPKAAEHRHAARVAGRSARVYDSGDGMATLAVETNGPAARIMQAVINGYATVLQDSDRCAAGEASEAARSVQATGGDEPSDEATGADERSDEWSDEATAVPAPAAVIRTRDQSRADAAYELLMLGARAVGSGMVDGYRPNVTVHVTVPMDTLVGSTDLPGDLEGYGPITANQARALAFEAGSVWRRLLTDPVSGAVLDVGHERYRPTAAIQDHVKAAMPRCLFPSCSRPATQCDLDHNEPWNHSDPEQGGETSVANLGTLCRRHHSMKTSGGWTWSVEATTGVVTWASPTGRVYVKYPETALVA